MRKKEFQKCADVLSLAIIVVGAICLTAMILLLINGHKPGILHKNTPFDKTHGSSGEYSCRLERTPDYGQNYVDRLIFLGDSSMLYLNESGALGGDTPSFQLWTGEDGSLPLDNSIDVTDIIYPETSQRLTVAEAVALKNPEYIVITLGIENGVAYCDEERFTAYYSKLIDSIKEASPTTRIILQSIFPVSKAYTDSNPSVTNEKIDRANIWIEALADEKELRYLDSASSLKDESGYLNRRYDKGDGLSLNSDGYLAVINYIRTHGYK